ncbi:PREDICTED: RNA polymerase II degradation factor 1-like [Papilio polytes]|uniref:RNA polymerase II degradation factor 1-like n=1 Tax=Papilio polytes TaxID=76194 RepID=UPI00067674A8|nr:PREDICTED: RNA polymerase II degradation factor 1-like [Papilio polytes]XP_013146566.1 PREDICTED: RNA polymerase II degradation factor 1-like [Papilio polytes]
MPQQKHRRRWRRKGMCCMPAPRPCIDSMPRRCMPHCAVCPPCPSAQHITASSSSHSDCSCAEEKFCTVESCKNAPQCITAKLRYCPYGFKDKSGTDLRSDQVRSKEMLEYRPSQEREMRAQYPQAVSTPYMAPQAQLAPEFSPSGYPSVPTISSIHSRAPDQFDQSMPQYAQPLPADVAQVPMMQQDFGPPEFQAPMQGRMSPISPDYQAPMQGRMMPKFSEPQPQMQGRMMPMSSEPQPQMQGRMMPISSESQPQMQGRMMPMTSESQPQMQGRMIPMSSEAYPQMQGRMMPISPESQAQMPERMMSISPEYQPPMQGRMMPVSPEPQALMQQRMLPRSETMPSPVSVTSGPSIQIRKMPDQYQPYYSQQQDTMPSYDYPAPRRPIPVSQEEGYVNIPRAEKQVGGYSPAQYSLGPAPEDSMYSSGLPPPRIDYGQKYSLSAVSSADRMKPRPIILHDEPRRMPQYTSEYVPSDRPSALSPRGKHGLIQDTRVQQPISDSSYVRYVSESSPALSDRIPGSQPVSTEGLARSVYRPPYQADTSMGVPYQADTIKGVPYQADISMGVPYQSDARVGAPYQSDARVGAPNQSDARAGTPYQSDARAGTPYQSDARVGAPYQSDARVGVPYQPEARPGAPYQSGIRAGAPYQADTRTGYQPSIVAEPTPKKSVHHALPDATYDTQMPMSPSAPERDDTRSVALDRSRRGYQPTPSGYETMMESPPSTGQSFSSRYPIGRPLAESTSIGSSRNIPMDYGAGSPMSPTSSVRTSEQRPSATDGLHKISYRSPSTGYNRFCKEPPQPEYVDKSIGFEYPLPQTELGATDETPPKCSCRYPPAFKHLECAGLMTGTCECNENDL